MKNIPLTPKNTDARLAAYTAAAGALLAPDRAGAEIVHTDLGGLTLLNSEDFTLNFELPGGTYGVTLGVTLDSNLNYTSIPVIVFTETRTNRAFASGAVQRAVDGDGLPIVLSFGQNIQTVPNGFGGGSVLAESVRQSGGSTSGGGMASFWKTTYTNGNFIGQSNVYLGLKVTDNGADYYGWVEISVNSSANTITLHSWAYENEGNSIMAGAIPEPGHIGLLAAGAAGLLAWRRKRQQMREEAGSEIEDA